MFSLSSLNLKRDSVLMPRGYRNPPPPPPPPAPTLPIARSTRSSTPFLPSFPIPSVQVTQPRSEPTTKPNRPKFYKKESQLGTKQTAQLEGLYNLSLNRNLREVTLAEREVLERVYGISEESFKTWWRKRRQQEREEQQSRGISTDARRGKMRYVEDQSDLLNSPFNFSTRLSNPRTRTRFHPNSTSESMNATDDLQSSGPEFLGPTFTQSSPPLQHTPKKFQSSLSEASSPLSSLVSSPPLQSTSRIPQSTPPPPPQEEKVEWFDLFFKEKEWALMKKMEDFARGGIGGGDGLDLGGDFWEPRSIKEEVEEGEIKFDCSGVAMGRWRQLAKPTQALSHLSTLIFSPSKASFIFSFSYGSAEYRIILPLTSISSLRIFNDTQLNTATCFFLLNDPRTVLFEERTPHTASWQRTEDFTDNKSVSNSTIWTAQLTKARQSIHNLFHIDEDFPNLLKRVWWGLYDSTTLTAFDLLQSFNYPLTNLGGEERWNPIKGRPVLLLEFRTWHGQGLWLRNLGCEKEELEEERTPSPLKKRCWEGIDATLAVAPSSSSPFKVDKEIDSDCIDPSYICSRSPELIPFNSPTPSFDDTFDDSSSSDEEDLRTPTPAPEPNPSQQNYLFLPTYLPTNFNLDYGIGTNDLEESYQPTRTIYGDSHLPPPSFHRLSYFYEGYQKKQKKGNEFRSLTEASYPSDY